jgi:hypothetical protein
VDYHIRTWNTGRSGVLHDAPNGAKGGLCQHSLRHPETQAEQKTDEELSPHSSINDCVTFSLQAPEMIRHILLRSGNAVGTIGPWNV